MAYNETIRDKVFRRLGFYVEWWYELQTAKDILADLRGDGTTTFLGTDRSDIDETLFGALCEDVAGQSEELESMRQSVAGMAGEYLTGYVKDQLDIPYDTPEGVLEYLIDHMGGEYPSDTVLENIPSGGEVEADPDNSVVPDTAPEFNTTQLARNNHHFCLTCVDDSEVDQERWTLTSDAHGEFGGELTTGIAADWEQVGLEDLTIHAAQAHDEDDVSAKVSNWRIAGAVRGTHTDGDGRTYLRFNDAPTAADSDDDLGMVGNWSLTTAVFGDESDTDGTLHVSVVRDPGDYVVLGGEKAALDASAIVLDGVSSSSTDNGTLYVKVEQTANGSDYDYTISLYTNSNRSSGLAGTGSVSAVIESDFPVEIDLSGGYDLSGKITLSSFDSTATTSDSTLIIQVPRYFVRLYKSSSRAAEDMVSEAVSYSPSGTSLSLTAQTGFTTAGTVDLNYVQDSESIVLTVPFFTVDMLRADPDDADTTDDDIVARAGTLSDLLDGLGDSVTLDFFAVNSSSLESASVDVSAATVSADYAASVVFGYAAGDKFTFETDIVDNGRFQTFLREQYSMLFPSSPFPSIPEAWAGA